MISIVVGICGMDFVCWFGGYVCVVCMMLNMFVLVGMGVMGLVVLLGVDVVGCEFVLNVFGVVGEIVWFDDEV